MFEVTSDALPIAPYGRRSPQEAPTSPENRSAKRQRILPRGPTRAKPTPPDSGATHLASADSLAERHPLGWPCPYSQAAQRTLPPECAPMKRMHALFLAIPLVLAATACMEARTWRRQAAPWTSAQLEDAEEVRVTRTDGSVITVHQASIVERDGQSYLVGLGTDPLTKPQRQFEVPLSEAASLEICKTSSGRVLGNWVIGAGTVFVILLVVASAAALVVIGA